MRSLVATLLAAATLASAAPALAQAADQAKELYDKGFAEMEAGHHRVACPMLAESQRLDPRPGTLFTLAYCEDQWGHAATATGLYAEYLAVFEALSPDRKAKQNTRPAVARERQEKLRPAIAELTLSLPPGAPAGTVVKRDGKELAAAALGTGLPVDPGDHTVSTQAPGGPVWEQTITLGKGERRTLRLEVRGAPAAPPPAPEGPAPPPQPQGPSRLRIGAYASAGVGAAGLVVGTIFGSLVAAKTSTIHAHCGAGIGQKDTSACDSVGLEAGNTAKKLATGGTIGFALAGAGAATLGGLLLAEWISAPPKIGTGSARFRAAVLAAGPDGATLGVRGAW